MTRDKSMPGVSTRPSEPHPCEAERPVIHLVQLLDSPSLGGTAVEAVSARQAVHPQRVLDSRLHPQEARDVGELLDGEDPFEPERLAAAVDHEGRLWPEVGIEWASQLDGAECVGAGGIGGEQSEGLQLRGRRDEALDRVPYDGEEAHPRGGLHPGVGAEVRASQRRLAADSASARTSAGRVEVATVAVGEPLGGAGQVTRGAWAGGAYSLVNVGAGRLVHVREGQPPLRTAQELEIAS
mmetsp:Transcript_33029/g.109118  ORF Transcript_33029/g.109118 Transcript_33029/m.109118 type:complete len:239 (+) Transcript_33029:83-799(+)